MSEPLNPKSRSPTFQTGGFFRGPDWTHTVLLHLRPFGRPRPITNQTTSAQQGGHQPTPELKWHAQMHREALNLALHSRKESRRAQRGGKSEEGRGNLSYGCCAIQPVWQPKMWNALRKWQSQDIDTNKHINPHRLTHRRYSRQTGTLVPSLQCFSLHSVLKPS